MKRIILAVAFALLCLLTVGISIRPGQAQQSPTLRPAPPAATPFEGALITLNQKTPSFGCTVRPTVGPNKPKIEVTLLPVPVTLSRFRATEASQAPSQVPPQARSQAATRRVLSQTPPSYTPREVVALADPTNYGQRYLTDVQGQVATYEPMVVLHETVGSASSAVNYFQTPHPNDADQVSYHTLIAQDGTVIYLVPPDKRAYGAGDSVFQSAAGMEAVQTNPDFPPSVNNFAYHISLETPPDGEHNGSTHSGYTNAQYQSLAWLVAKTGVPDARISTHKLVDRSGMRQDPRSFNPASFLRLLNSYPRTHEIAIGCSVESEALQPEQQPEPQSETR
jgi:N-acetylmuramoyl-L-alanine amidase